MTYDALKVSRGSQSRRIILVAVDVRSAHNIGSFFRTCDGFGAELWLVGICPYPSMRNDSRLPHVAQRAQIAIEKTALGAEKSVLWRRFETLEACVNVLHAEGVTVVAIEQDKKSKKITRLPSTKPIALLVGREVEGLSDQEKRLCDDCFEIPMIGKKESFNVSIAAGISLYQARYK